MIELIHVIMCLQLFLFSCVCVANSSGKDVPTVQTNVGEIIGTATQVDVFGRKMAVHRFLGIPYAEPPVGELRFQKPVPKKPFASPYKATEHGNACLQMLGMPMSERHDKQIPTGEDCLLLNVYVPAENHGNLAVMVWIHGGGFFGGASNTYKADTLAAYGNVIVVTINYRVSIWGFLSTNDAHAPGNYGLWDQHLAIKWIHENVEKFGGDPGKVTIFGESAGAASVVYQSFYEGNKGLFQRGIAHSGSITAKWASCDNPMKDAVSLGKLVGCDHEDSKALIDCLKNQTPELLNVTLNDFTNGLIDETETHFAPSVDGEFVKESPKDLLLGNSDTSTEGRKLFGSLDFMSGINAEEGLSAITPDAGFEDPDNFKPNRSYYENDLLSESLQYVFGKQMPALIKDIIAHEYTDWSDPEDTEKRLSKFVALFSDLFFSLPLIETVQLHHSLSRDSKSTYMFNFDILPSQRVLTVPSTATRPTHGDDLVYTFFEESDGVLTYFRGREDFKPTDWDREHAKYIMTVFSNFAKSGNPNKPTPVKMFWPTYTTEHKHYLHITPEMTSDSVKSHFLSNVFNLWKNVIPELYSVLNVQDGDGNL